MSGIAEVLLNLGCRVSGSDLKESDITRRLSELGGTIQRGHDPAQVTDVDVVVVSSAVRRDNPEVVEARARKIPVIPRAEMLAELMRLKYGIAIAGSHGKTTTTSMAAHLLAQAGLDPTAVVGGKVNAFGSNAKLGKGEYMVVEADESDGSFLRLSPTIAVVTNIDPEHLDHWKTAGALRQGFLDFVNRVPFYGASILCIDHPTVQSLPTERRVVTYASRRRPTQRQRIEAGPAVSFEAAARQHRWRFLGHGGAVHAPNARPRRRWATSRHPGGDDREALAASRQRRFTARGEAGGVTVVDDTATTPWRATPARRSRRLRAAGGVPFQPHRHTHPHS
jgi:UDP-N-acetylmuramate--alanine ligase